MQSREDTPEAPRTLVKGTLGVVPLMRAAETSRVINLTESSDEELGDAEIKETKDDGDDDEEEDKYMLSTAPDG